MTEAEHLTERYFELVVAAQWGIDPAKAREWYPPSYAIRVFEAQRNHVIEVEPEVPLLLVTRMAKVERSTRRTIMLSFKTGKRWKDMKTPPKGPCERLLEVALNHTQVQPRRETWVTPEMYRLACLVERTRAWVNINE